MKKKIVTLLLLATMVLGITACGSKSSDNKETPSAETETSKSTETENTEPTETITPETEQESQTAPETETSNPQVPNTEEANKPSTEQAAEIPSIEEVTVNSPEDAELLLKSKFGTEDAETGYPYSFGYIDTFTIEGGEYYGFVWSWLVDNDHMSRLTEVFVKTDGSAIYEGAYDGENCEFYTDNMLEAD